MSEPPRVQVIPYPNESAPRVETGAVQFGNDWPGLFVRGDAAISLAFDIDRLERFLDALPGAADFDVDQVRENLRYLAEIIRSRVRF